MVSLSRKPVNVAAAKSLKLELPMLNVDGVNSRQSLVQQNIKINVVPEKTESIMGHKNLKASDIFTKKYSPARKAPPDWPNSDERFITKICECGSKCVTQRERAAEVACYRCGRRWKIL